MLRRSCLAAVIVATFGGLYAWADNPADDVDATLPRQALSRLGTDRWFHGPHIRQAAISPDGRIVASTSEEVWWYEGETTKYTSDKTITLWDSATGKRIRELEVPHAPVFSFVFSPDGKQLAVSFGREVSGIVVLEIESGKLIRRFADAALGLVRFTPDGKSLLLTEGYHTKLAVWNVESGKRTGLGSDQTRSPKWLKGALKYVSDGDLSPDGKFLKASDDPKDYSEMRPGLIVPPHVSQSDRIARRRCRER